MSGDHDQHRPYEDLAVRHVMGSLDDAEASAFRSHLLDCGDCRARVGELRSIASDLASVERDERRERAAQRVEIKERDPEEPEHAPPMYTPSRGGRVILVVGVLLLVILSIWNFVLRGQNEGLQAIVENEQDSAEVINFGEPWEQTAQAAGVEGVARVERGSLAVMVRGTDDRAPYQVVLYDRGGERIRTDDVTSRDEQVRYFRERLPAAVSRVEVSLDRANGDTVVFRALKPSEG